MKMTSRLTLVGGAFLLASAGVLAQAVPAGVPAGARACAQDGGACRVTGNWTGVYGVQGRFVAISGSGPFTCLPSGFPTQGGLPNLRVGDPAPNVQKTCWVAQGSVPASGTTPGSVPATGRTPGQVPATGTTPAAGQQTQTVGRITFNTTPAPATLASDGQSSARAEYVFRATGHDGTTPYVGSLPVTAIRVSGDGTLTCSRLTTNSTAKYGAGVVLAYKVTGFSDVQLNNNEVLRATTQFALALNDREFCKGSFRYERDTRERVTAKFQLMVGDSNSGAAATAPINIYFRAPTAVAPRFHNTNERPPIGRGVFESAILSSAKQTPFKYGLVYFNSYGLTAPGSTVECTLGSREPIRLTVDASGRVPLAGNINVSMRPRAAGSTSPAVWDVTTSLTGTTPAFTLAKGQNIGAVSCRSADTPPATFTQPLGNW